MQETWVLSQGRLQSMGLQRVRHNGACTHSGQYLASSGTQEWRTEIIQVSNLSARWVEVTPIAVQSTGSLRQNMSLSLHLRSPEAAEQAGLQPSGKTSLELLVICSVFCDSYLRALFFTFFFFFFLHHTAWGILVLLPRIELMPLAVEAKSPNHWTTSVIYFVIVIWESFLKNHILNVQFATLSNTTINRVTSQNF